MSKTRYFVHYKGGLYQLLGYAHHSETLEDMVIYQALYGLHKMWVRPKTLFFSKVEIKGVLMDRFKEISEEEMLCLLHQKNKNI